MSAEQRACSEDCDGNGWIVCWRCGGAGGWHDCGDDCCSCLDPEEITQRCGQCGGEGTLRCLGSLHDDEPEVAHG